MKILAVEFSSEQRSVAIIDSLAELARQVRGSAAEQGGRNAHAFALVEQALRDAKMEREEVECIAIGLGPGSYTGIRAAIALGQGWQLARETNLIGISSVECLAAQACGEGIQGRVNIIVDAQRGEFYLATYEIGENRFSEVESLHLATVGEIEERIATGQLVIGPEANGVFPAAKNMFPSASALGQLAGKKSDFVAGEKLAPIYLREVSFVKAPAPRAVPR